MKKPQIRYEWRRQPSVTFSMLADDHETTTVQSPWRVCWSLYGGNGEFMCGDGGQGYQDKYDAGLAANACAVAMTGKGIDWLWCKSIGPGRKPKA